MSGKKRSKSFCHYDNLFNFGKHEGGVTGVSSEGELVGEIIEEKRPIVYDLSQKWYAVDQDALDGPQAVKKVEKGFRGTSEINTPYYGSDLITIEELEATLKEAGTCLGVEKREKGYS